MAIHRIIVRGFFDGLDENQVDDLRAEQADHDILRSQFTAAGSLVYGPEVGPFSFRFEVRTTGDEDDATELDAALRIGTQRAVAVLARLGVGYKHLRATGSNMADVWK